MTKYKGTIFLIPSFLSENNGPDLMAPQILDVVRNTDYYLVENIRSARRFISKLGTGKVIEELHFFVLDKKTKEAEVQGYFAEIPKGSNIGVISEAGCPGVADPGALAVTFGHKNGYMIKPLPGPSSILLALMGSGFSGQQFCFKGYLPMSRPERVKQLKELERASRKGETQIFMETPFRNNHLLEDVLKELDPEIELCLVADVTGADELIKTQKIKDWKKNPVDLYKKPCIFLLGQSK
jgi:16S rRNA (cytidine1402-2'-O)-methyltransferase